MQNRFASYAGLYRSIIYKLQLVIQNFSITDEFAQRERTASFGIDNPALTYDDLDYDHWYQYSSSSFDQDMASNIRRQRTTGMSPPAYNAARDSDDDPHNSDGRSDRKSSLSEDEDEELKAERAYEEDDDKVGMGCLQEFQFSIIDSEYDETLGFPDSVTILSTVGDKPVLVERTNTDDDEEEDDESVALRRGAEIPFSSLYGPSVKFNSFQRKVFIPGREIEVRIVDTDRSVTTHLLNPNL